MKKRTMAVGGLLLAVAMTGYSVAGTYAKYTSKVDLTDDARVAKWSFGLASNNAANEDGSYDLDLFANSYKLENSTNNKGNKVWVKSFDDKNVVAPGTKGTANFELTGSIETAFTVDYKMNAENDFIVYYTLNDDNTVKEMSINGSDTKFGTDKVYEYRPISYTITHNRNGAPVTPINDVLKNKNAKELAEAFNTYNANNAQHLDTHIFTPGNYTLSFVVDWKWDTTNTVKVNIDENTEVALDSTEVDKLDTFAGENLYDKTINFNISVVANQVAEDYSTKTPTVTP